MVIKKLFLNLVFLLCVIILILNILTNVNAQRLDNVAGIIKTGPLKNKFTNGNFIIELKNPPDSLILKLGNIERGFLEGNIDLNNCSTSRNFVCGKKVNLSMFDNSDIFYYFKFNISNKIFQSSPVKVKVDVTPPIIEEIKFEVKKNGYVSFDIKINEKNINTIKFFDITGSQQLTNLCSVLKNQRCISKKWFSKGYHDLIIIVLDEAGNYINKEINFSI